jgi:hypothetical protein
LDICKDRIKMLRRKLELKFKRESVMKQSRTGWFSQVLEGIKKGRKCFQEVKKERLGREWGHAVA